MDIPVKEVRPHGLREGRAFRGWRFTSFSSWRVLAGQELIGDYEDFRVPVCLVEQQPNICLTLLIHLKLGDQRAIDLVGDILGIDRLAPFRRQKLVERLLEFRAGFAVYADKESLVAERHHVLFEVLGDEDSDLLNPVVGCEKCAKSDSSVERLVQFVDFGNALCCGET
jgi:hypothetical protein